MTMTYIVRVFNGESLQTTMCFHDYGDAIEAEETFKQAGCAVVLISEATEDLGFDDYDAE